MSEGYQVSKVTHCVKILKWHWLTHSVSKGRYRAARAAKNIARIANAVPFTLYSRVTLNDEIVVLNCKKYNQCLTYHKSSKKVPKKSKESSKKSKIKIKKKLKKVHKKVHKKFKKTKIQKNSKNSKKYKKYKKVQNVQKVQIVQKFQKSKKKI